MRVRIAYTVEVSDHFRLALNYHYGQKGKASREDVVLWYQMNGESCDEDLLSDYEEGDE